MQNNLIKLNGRYTINNNIYYFYNGGSGFSFKMKGEGFVAVLKGSYFYVIIDRDYDKKIKIASLNMRYFCYFNDNKEHLIDIVKANEANDNTLCLTELNIDGDLLPYDFKYDKKVKVYGDSTIAGFGILSHDGDPSIDVSDSVRDFCYHALYELNMDMDIVSASGFGLAFSAYTNPKNVGIFDFIDNVSVSNSSKWKDNSKTDLLIISLGTNDNSYIEQDALDKKEAISSFKAKYKALIDKELALNSELKILMVYGTLKEETAYYLNEEVYKELKPLYKNLYIHKFNGDNTAISHHAYVDQHDLMAEELKQVIKSIF